MAIGSGVPYNSHTGNGVTRTFAYGFTLLDAGDLVVTVDDVPTSAYTVAGLGDAGGGSITFTVAPANGAQVLLLRVIELIRATDYQDNGDLLAGTLNDDIDRLWMALQQNDAGIGRALRAPELAAVLPELPSAADRADRLLGFNSAGDPTVFAPADGSAASLALDLASSASATKGPGQVGGPNHQLNYAAATLGRHLVEVAALVTDYPWLADKTGAADAQPAIQACIDYWAAKGATDGVIYRVRVPAGKFKLGAGIKTCAAATGAGQVGLVGDGMFSTRFMPAGNFTAVNIVTSYVESGGFSIEWPTTVQASIPSTRIGVEFASGSSQVSQCNIRDILVTYAYKSFYLRDWTGAPGGLGTMYVVDFDRLISFRAASVGFELTAVNGGSTTHNFTSCWANCSNSVGAAGGIGFKFSGINDILMINCAVDLCKDRAIYVLDGYQFNSLGLALESCFSTTDGIPLVHISSGVVASFTGTKEIACTINIPGGKSYGIFVGESLNASIVGYARAALTVLAGTLYKIGLNSSGARISVDSSVLPADAQDNGYHSSVTYDGIRYSSVNAAPSYGTWPAGSMVRYLAPTVGGAEGAVSPAGGSPGTWYEFGAVKLQGSATYDPPSLADGAGATTTVTVTGAALGDFVAVSFSGDLGGITLTAWVSSANTVSVRFQNESGGALDLGSGTLRARVVKQ